MATRSADPFLVPGFRSSVLNAGVKDATLDFSLVVSDVPATGAAVFTQSSFCGHAVTIGREHVADGRLQAVLVVSKNANVANGARGDADARELIDRVAQAAGVAPRDVLHAATGVIGRPLPMDRLRAAIPALVAGLAPGGLDRFAEAIMTTDRAPKIRSVRIGTATLVGVCKGAAMIEPHMATLLVFFFTDAAVAHDDLARCLRAAVAASFNTVTIDTDTSTSDTAGILANGLAGPVELAEFEAALTGLAAELARDVVRGAEGATKVIEVVVEGAPSERSAREIAHAIAASPLVKTAVFGADPNWGRVAMAIGKSAGTDAVDQERVAIRFGPIVAYDGGVVESLDLAALEELMRRETVVIGVDLRAGGERATALGCDLGYDYVRLNAEYTT